MDYDRVNSPLYQLLLTGKQLRLPRNQIINLFDDGQLNLIKAGYIKRYLITKEGTKSIQVIYGPNDIFPLTPVYKSVFKMDIYSGPEQYYYESMTDVEIFSIDQDTLQTGASQNPLIYRDLYYAAGLRLNSYIHRLESMSLRAANKKLAHQILYLANIFGQPGEEGVVIPIPLTHQNLAEILNLARETVSNWMSRFQEKGILSGSNKNLIVTDMEKLRREAR